MTLHKIPFLALVLVTPLLLANSCTPSPSPYTKATDVINGITVPPEPDPTANNATAFGVDSNSNGVRDDVERKIAKNTPEKFDQLIAYTKWLQKDLLDYPLDEADKVIEADVYCGRSSNDPENNIIEYLFSDGSINNEYVSRLHSRAMPDIDCGDGK